MVTVGKIGQSLDLVSFQGHFDVSGGRCQVLLRLAVPFLDTSDWHLPELNCTENEAVCQEREGNILLTQLRFSR